MTHRETGISAILLSAAHQHWAGEPNVGPRTAGRLADRFAGQPGMIEAAVKSAVLPLVSAAWTIGWSPDDLYQLARRRLDGFGVGYTVDAIAMETAQRAGPGMSKRSRDELRQIGALPWWRSDQGHLGQWAGRQGRSLADALATVIEVLALLLALPPLPTIAAPSGGSTSGPASPGVDQKVLARVRGLLAKAESTTFPEEAEALSAKAQELMSRYCLERIVVESDRGSGPPPSSARRLWLDNPYVAAKALLVDAVAEANRCRAVLSEKLGFTTVVGDEVDLEIVEVLTTSLLIQATRAMVAAGRQSSSTEQSRSRSFRQSFLVAYAIRIRERLITARDTGTAAAVSDPARLLPVLAARERVVNELFESMFPGLVPRSVNVGNAAGWHAGRAAADLAVLETRRPVGSGEQCVPPGRGKS